MRCFPALLALLLLPFVTVACVSSDDNKDVTNILEVGTGEAERQPEVAMNETTRMIRNTSESVKRYNELRLQGMSRAMRALRNTISRAVDENFDAFRDQALAGKYIHRNMALRCLGFASERRADARETLIQIASNPDERTFMIANAALQLGTLRDPETPLEPIVALMGSGNPTIRTNAADAFKDIVLVKETPRELSPQYLTAIDRLATMLYDKHNRLGRRAAVWALGNLRHPDTFDHLVAALDDDDQTVQIGGLRGLELLGDQRCIDPVIEYMGKGPGQAGTTWSIAVLKATAIQTGLAKEPGEMAELGDSPNKWKEFFRDARMR
ncbi:MAG: HEAT repeat domain-containing protein [Planctomycetota bacterium]|jgi:HEAT repeat protein